MPKSSFIVFDRSLAGLAPTFGGSAAAATLGGSRLRDFGFDFPSSSDSRSARSSSSKSGAGDGFIILIFDIYKALLFCGTIVLGF
jgi:hypothetical protein